MTTITVMRSAGDRPGEDIVDPLASEVQALIERGRNEIDEATPADGVEHVVRFDPAYRSGDLVEVNDSQQGATWRGKITAVEHVFEPVDRYTRLTIRRPR